MERGSPLLQSGAASPKSAVQVSMCELSLACQLFRWLQRLRWRGVLTVQHGVVDGGEHHLWSHEPREEL